MNKQEALLHFKEHIVQELLEQRLNEVQQIFNQRHIELTADLIATFQQFCQQVLDMQDEEKKADIAFINFSMLRTSILSGSYVYLIEAYSNEWYEDPNKCHFTYDVSWLYSCFALLMASLKQESKKYMSVLNEADAEIAALETLPYFHQFIVALVRFAIPDFVESSLYQSIRKSTKVTIRVGEYKDISEQIYAVDEEAAVIEPSILQNQDGFAYSDAHNANLHGLYMERQDMRYSDFTGAQLGAARFKECFLFGTRWYRAVMPGCDFGGSVISDADFRYADLQNTVFCQASAQRLDHKGKRLPGVMGLHFEYANLDHADLTGIHFFDQAYFTGASMNQTRMYLHDRDKFIFSDEQRKAIQWVEGEQSNETAAILLTAE